MFRFLFCSVEIIRQMSEWMYRFCFVLFSLKFVYYLDSHQKVTRRNYRSRSDTDKLVCLTLHSSAIQKNNDIHTLWMFEHWVIRFFSLNNVLPNIYIYISNESLIELCDWFYTMMWRDLFIEFTSARARCTTINHFYELHLQLETISDSAFYSFFLFATANKRNWKEKLNCSIF